VLSLEVGGEQLVLLPQRACCLPAHRTLLVADAHVGKAATFRRLGVPVPEATTAGMLQRLDQALQASGATRIVFLGDLLHSVHAHAAATWQTLRRWRARHATLDLMLVRGNHDRHAGDPPADWGVQVVDEPFRLGALALKHHPEPEPGAYVLAGHVHPGLVLGGPAYQRLRLPCFHFGPAVGLLPAFGDFTGLHVVRPEAGDRVYVVAGGRVLAAPV
jgi:DNA ligase-associated metallophosphoesterase